MMIAVRTIRVSHLTNPFPILEPQDQEISKFYENLVPRILKLQNCERVRRVQEATLYFTIEFVRKTRKRKNSLSHGDSKVPSRADLLSCRAGITIFFFFFFFL